MTLQQFFNSYHLDSDGDYSDRLENARCFVCDALEHPNINASLSTIYSFASDAFSVSL
jgi:hypothetical protein